MIRNKTWKNFSEENANEIKRILLEVGGIEKGAKGNAEVWKIKISDSEFTYYSSKRGGTLYCNGSRSGDPVIYNIYEQIDNLLGGIFIPSYKTIRKLDGRPPVKKAIPPINENFLSKEFIDEFNKGRLSIESLSVVCPHCGSVLKSVKFAIFTRNGKKISTIKCDNCDQFIQNVDFTLRYFCGYVLPDSNAVSRHVLSNDLNSQRFFADFKVLLSSVVRKEVDGTKTGKRELEALRKFHNKGRIKLINVGEVIDITGMESAEKDEIIIKHCLENNAILLSGDKSMITFGISRNIFVIDIG